MYSFHPKLINTLGLMSIGLTLLSFGYVAVDSYLAGCMLLVSWLASIGISRMRVNVEPPIDIATSITRRYLVYSATGWRVYLHHVHSPDIGRELHNHPTRWWCLVLRGGYIQLVRREGGPAAFERISRLNRMTVADYHRIVAVKPRTWTLCLTWPRLVETGNWGFLVNNRHVDRELYREQKKL